MFFVMHLQQAGSQWNPISSKSISLLQAIKQTQIQTVNTNTYLHSGYNVPIYKNTVILPTQSIFHLCDSTALESRNVLLKDTATKHELSDDLISL